jgi:hypothetical protein
LIPKHRLHDVSDWAQSAYSDAEQRILDAIWKHYKLTKETVCHEFEMSEENLAKLIGKDVSNIGKYLRSLEQKCALHKIAEAVCFGPNRRAARRIIYSHKEALTRRNKKGLTHVIKDRGKVYLVNPQMPGTWPNLTPISKPKYGGSLPVQKDEYPGNLPTHFEEVIYQPICSGNLPDNIGQLQNNHLRQGSQGSSLSAVSSVLPDTSTTMIEIPQQPAEALQCRQLAGHTEIQPIVEAIEYYVPIDDEAVSRIWNTCRREFPEVTVQQVAAVADHRAAQASHKAEKGKIANPVGLLIDEIPRYVKAALDKQRRHEEVEAERRKQAIANIIRQANLYMADPDSCEEAFEWAENRLAEHGQPIPARAVRKPVQKPMASAAGYSVADGFTTRKPALGAMEQARSILSRTAFGSMT